MIDNSYNIYIYTYLITYIYIFILYVLKTGDLRNRHMDVPGRPKASIATSCVALR